MNTEWGAGMPRNSKAEWRVQRPFSETRAAFLSFPFLLIKKGTDLVLLDGKHVFYLTFPDSSMPSRSDQSSTPTNFSMEIVWKLRKWTDYGCSQDVGEKAPHGIWPHWLGQATNWKVPVTRKRKRKGTARHGWIYISYIYQDEINPELNDGEERVFLSRRRRRGGGAAE